MRFALPVVLTNLGQQLYQIVDAAIVGRGVGVEILFYVEPVAWLLAWLFVLFPYYWYQKRRLPVCRGNE